MTRVQVREVSAEQLSLWEYHTLMALAGGERHAEQLVRDVDRLSMGRVQVELPVMEALLRRLARAGLIVVARHADDEETRHVHYLLTRLGEERVARETHEMTVILRHSDGTPKEIRLA